MVIVGCSQLFSFYWSRSIAACSLSDGTVRAMHIKETKTFTFITPQLHIHTKQSFSALALRATNLQWTTMGPQSTDFTFLTCLTKERIAFEKEGTPWSGQEVKWKCLIMWGSSPACNNSVSSSFTKILLVKHKHKLCEVAHDLISWSYPSSFSDRMTNYSRGIVTYHL